MNRAAIVYLISFLSSAFVALLFLEVLSRLDADLGNTLLFIPLSLSVFMIPLGVIRRARNTKVISARKRVSDFLRDLSEYTLYGTPLSKAVLLVSSNDYGALNEDVRNLSMSVSMGTPVEEALRNFGNALNDPEIQRLGILLRKSSESGSNTSDVISMISQFTSQMQLLTEERAGEMKNYNLILMISFAVFLLVMVVIDVRFFDAISISSGAGILFQSAGAPLLKRIFDTGIYVEAIGIGFIIGIIRDRNPVSGFVEAGGMLLVSSVILLISGAL